MATLSEQREWEEQARGYWIDSLMAVDEMLSMHADYPYRGMSVDGFKVIAPRFGRGAKGS